MLLPGAAIVLDVLRWVFAAVGLYAFVHAARQRSDAFTAVDKLTKNKWLAITGGGTLAIALLGPLSFFIAFIGIAAVLVYLADVRPKVDEVQRGQRW